jgi:hypothetical protein
MQKKQFKNIDKIFMAEKATLDTKEPIDPYILRPSQPQHFEEEQDISDEKMTPAFPSQYNTENVNVSNFENETSQC